MIQDGRFDLRGSCRREIPAHSAGVEWAVTGDLHADADWRRALENVQAVVHLAARVHVMRETVADPLREFRLVNVAGTLNLVRQAASAGVRRFVFVSSVKVNGDVGMFTEASPPAPPDAYGTSKHETELGLRKTAADTGIEVAIVRPPLVYGPQVKGNFRALMRGVARGIPLPLGAIHNRRSLIALDNLADFILACIEHPAAANETFLVSDGEDCSTTDLIRRLARAMGRPPRLIPVPASVLMAGATLLGKRDMATRLLGSLQVDISKACQRLGWTPPISMDEGLRRAAASL